MATADRVRQGGSFDRVLAIGTIDQEVTADQAHAGEVQQVAGPVAQQPHQRRAAATIIGGIDDLLDTAGGGEVGQADVHRPRANRHNLIDTAAAAVGIGVKPLEVVAAPVGVVGIAAADPEAVSAFAAVEQVFVAATADRVRQDRTRDRVVAIGAIDQEVTADQAHSGEVQQVAGPVAQQPHQRRAAATIIGGIDDLLDAIIWGETGQADIHRTTALHQDNVSTGGTGISIGFMPLKTVGSPVKITMNMSTDEVDVSSLAAV